jgi:phosphate/sulfate permease
VQGASAELMAATLIAGAGPSGYSVNTTHVVAGGIAASMVGSHAGVRSTTAISR